MARARYIHIRNWRTFQHYKNGKSVPWIKDYTAQLSSDDYLDLTFHRRGILHGLRLEYARTAHRDAADGTPGEPRGMRDDTASLSRRLGKRVTRPDLDALNHAGCIVFSSRQVLEPVKTASTPDEEKEKDKEKDAGPDFRKVKNGPCPECQVGGGRHIDGCSRAPAPNGKPKLELVKSLDEEAA